MTTTVQVRQRGLLTLPAKLRKRYNIKPGDTLSLVDLDGVLILTPMVPMVPELAGEIKRARIETGLSGEDLLATLREQREQYVRENYDAQPKGRNACFSRLGRHLRQGGRPHRTRCELRGPA